MSCTNLGTCGMVDPTVQCVATECAALCGAPTWFAQWTTAVGAAHRSFATTQALLHSPRGMAKRRLIVLGRGADGKPAVAQEQGQDRSRIDAALAAAHEAVRAVASA